MSINSDKICRLCFKVTGNEFVVIEETFKEIFNFLLLQIDLDVTYNPVICWNCAEAVQKCFYFKSRCIDTEELILAVVIERRRAGFELKDIYEDKDVGYITEYFNVCRFCMNRLGTNNFISFDDLLKKVAFVEALMPLYMSDLDIDIVKDPVICTTCKEKLEYYLKFAKRCLDVEEKISTYCRDKGINSAGQVRLSSAMLKYIAKQSEESTRILKQETNTFENKICDTLETVEPLDIKDEVLNLKCLEEYTEILDKKQGVNVLEFIKIEHQDELTKPEILNKSFSEITLHLNLDELNVALTTDEDESKVEQKQDIEYDVLSPNELLQERYKCATCAFETKYKSGLTSHLLIHKDKSEVEIYRCETCSYETRYKTAIKRHVLNHKNEAKAQEIYKCATCSFETKHKSALVQHVKSHKNKSELKMYKCRTCWYESKHKSSLKYHELKHKDKSEVELYKCATCSYGTKYKSDLKSHFLNHKDKSAIKTYACETCPYETKYKSHINRHKLKHMDKSQVKIYKCATCTYETKYKGHLKSHMLRHKNESEVEMYDCAICGYGTKYKSRLKAHILSHADKSEFRFKCATCRFETKHKARLKLHILSHRDKPEVEIYRCGTCSFATRYKGYLKSHILSHKDKSEVDTFRCATCSFETKYKCSLRSHMLRHKNKLET